MVDSIRDVNTPEFHLWTDVLHARALSCQAKNSWDRGSYVRWCIVTGWTVLEMVFRKVLKDENIGHRFKEDVESAINTLGLPRLDWGAGVWQKIIILKEKRKQFIHTKLDQDKLFLDSSVANEYVNDLQQGIIAIYRYTQQPVPNWTMYIEDQGWDNGDRFRETDVTIQRQGAQMDDPKSIIISYTYKGLEHCTEVLPAGSDYTKIVENLINTIKKPITCIKVYKGHDVIFEQQLMMRGGF